MRLRIERPTTLQNRQQHNNDFQFKIALTTHWCVVARIFNFLLKSIAGCNAHRICLRIVECRKLTWAQHAHCVYFKNVI